MPAKSVPRTSKAKRSRPQSASNVRQALCDQLSSWLPGMTYVGSSIRSSIDFTHRSSSSLPSFVRSPATMTASASVALILRTARRRRSSDGVSGETCRSHRKSILTGGFSRVGACLADTAGAAVNVAAAASASSRAENFISEAKGFFIRGGAEAADTKVLFFSEASKRGRPFPRAADKIYFAHRRCGGVIFGFRLLRYEKIFITL